MIRWLLGDSAAGWDEADLALQVPFPEWVTVLVVSAALAALALAVWNLRGVSPGRRALLLSLRFGTVLVALYLYLQPAVRLLDVTRVRNHLVILADSSLSMSLPDGAGGPTRAERVSAFLAAAEPQVQALAASHVVEVYHFGEEVEPVTLAGAASEAESGAEGTKIIEALEDVSERYRGKDLAGIVLLSDGGDNGTLAQRVGAGAALEADLRERLGRLGTEVHALGAGRQDVFTDLAVRRVVAHDFAFVHNLMRVEAVISAAGVGERSVQVTLEHGGSPVQSKTVALRAEGGLHDVSFAFSPERVGKFVYTVRADVLPGEAVPENNIRQFVVRVIRDKVRVLQVAGRPSWDERFLRKTLKKNPNVDLVSFFILRTSTSLQSVPPSELSLIPFPVRELFEEELRSFDLVILQDFDYRPFRNMARYLPHIAEYAEAGGALAMIGGSQGYSAGGYQGTRLADVLPVEMPSGALAEAVLSTDAFPARLTAAGRRHPLTALSPDRAENDRIWRDFPELEGVNIITRLRPDSVVLVEHPFANLSPGRNHPVVVLGRAGQGRVMSVLTDSLWRWALPAAGDGGDPLLYQRFWNNAVRWLLKDPEWKQIKVSADKDVYLPGEAVRLQITAVNHSYEPAVGLPVAVEVRAEPSSAEGGGKAAVLRLGGKTDEAGRLILEFPAPAAGAHVVSARATLQGEPEEETEVLLVGGERPELDDPRVREDLLKAVAEATGGTYHRLPEGALDELPLREPRVLRVDRRRSVELWNTPWILLAGVAFMASEWWIRRRHGLL